jgi:hypothetical protein
MKLDELLAVVMIVFLLIVFFAFMGSLIGAEFVNYGGCTALSFLC